MSEKPMTKKSNDSTVMSGNNKKLNFFVKWAVYLASAITFGILIFIIAFILVVYGRKTEFIELKNLALKMVKRRGHKNA